MYYTMSLHMSIMCGLLSRSEEFSVVAVGFIDGYLRCYSPVSDCMLHCTV